MKILLTGANGYIGRRLKDRLLREKTISLRLFVTHKQTPNAQENIEVVQGNTFDTQSLDRALEGIDTAYYLIHSMASDNYRELDRKSAQNFLDACIKAAPTIRRKKS